MTRPSIYEAAGGSAAFLALAAAHHERCLADPELNHAFSRDVMSYAPVSAVVPADLPIPHWSWNGLVR